jgi:DNA-binding transcriptional MerR regulator
MSSRDARERFLTEEKLYYSIGEASEIVGVKQFVLRYWETEFPSVKPVKSRSNRRLYRREDVERLLKIEQLLHEEKYTIDGARKQLEEHAHPGQLGLGLDGDTGNSVVAPEGAGEPIKARAVPPRSAAGRKPLGGKDEIIKRLNEILEILGSGRGK